MTSEKTKYDTLAERLFPRAQELIARRNARVLSGFLLNYWTRQLTGGLSLQDLPDVVEFMDYRDTWQEEFEAAGVDTVNLAQALRDAEETVRDVLRAEGMTLPDESEGGE